MKRTPARTALAARTARTARTVAAAALAGSVAAACLSAVTATPAAAEFTTKVTGRASVLPGAVESAYRGDAEDTSIDGSGRYLVFATTSQLVPHDTDTVKDVYVKDLLTDGLERINVTTDGSPANGDSFAGAIAGDGRYVAFWSWASDLVPGDTKGKADVFLRDRALGTTERVSVTSAEAEANGASPSIINGDSLDLSDDGRYVTFTSSATNLGPDANTLSDVFVRDRTNGTTTLVSVSSAEAAGTSDSYGPSMSATGRFLAFESDAPNLVAPDTNSGRDVYVRDTVAGTTLRASLADNDTQPTGQSFTGWISDNGDQVAFASTAKMVPADANISSDVYLRTLSTGATTLISRTPAGAAAGDSHNPKVAGAGGSVAFSSTSTTILAGANGFDQVYVNRGSVLERISVSSAGTIGGSDSYDAMADRTASVISFTSKAANLIPGDSGYRDAFFRRTLNGARGASLDAFAAEVSGDFGYQSPASIAAAVRAGASTEHLVLSASRTPAFAGKRPALIRLYYAYFLRLPDVGGLTYWTNKLTSGTPLDRVSASFAASSEFKAKYGSKTNGQFVTLIYQNIFARNPDAAGLAYWTKRLDTGTSRGTVMTNFSESSEGRRKLQAPVDVTLVSLGLDGTIPSGAMLNGMLAAADQSNAVEGAVRYLLEP